FHVRRGRSIRVDYSLVRILVIDFIIDLLLPWRGITGVPHLSRCRWCFRLRPLDRFVGRKGPWRFDRFLPTIDGITSDRPLRQYRGSGGPKEKPADEAPPHEEGT